jgi:hypothetical protein
MQSSDEVRIREPRRREGAGVAGHPVGELGRLVAGNLLVQLEQLLQPGHLLVDERLEELDGRGRVGRPIGDLTLVAKKALGPTLYRSVRPSSPTSITCRSLVLSCTLRTRLASREARPVELDREMYRTRSIVECLIGWLKECRRAFSRFEKSSKNFGGMIKMAFIQGYLRLSFR